MTDDQASPPGAVAIVGLAGRFPGAPDVDTFWRNLREGVESIATLTDSDLAAAGVDESVWRTPGYVRRKPILERIEWFDAGFFGIGRRDAELMDPQHRIFLECAWEALESAGHYPATFPGSVGVFGGSSMSTYHAENVMGSAAAGPWPGWLQALVGNDKEYLVTRLAYVLDARGPAVCVQTACSTSLAAVHLACASLLDRECDLALAGGITVRVPHRSGYQYEEGSLYAPDGHCRPFDREARGTVFGNGAGLVVLRRLEDALADGDRIRAVIRGSAINNDGAVKVGFTAPSQSGQALVIQEALGVAGIRPDSIQYIEAHGTGTPLGDPIEFAALQEVFGGRAADRADCVVGSVKGNVGHLECAAGMAGLIKTVLAMEHGLIPGTVNFQALNREIVAGDDRLRVSARPAPWPRGDVPRRAGVSSFGMGGTNVHVILEEAPPPTVAAPSAEAAGPWLLPLSAADPVALKALAIAYATQLEAAATPADVRDIVYTASVRRSTHPHRLAAVGLTGAELARDLARAVAAPGSGPDSGASNGRPLVFVHAGGALDDEDIASLRTLLEEPAAREVLARLEPELLRQGCDRLLRALEQARAGRPAGGTDDGVMALVSIATAALWRSWGVEPDRVLVPGLDEIAAALVSHPIDARQVARAVAAHRPSPRPVATAALESALAKEPRDQSPRYLLLSTRPDGPARLQALLDRAGRRGICIGARNDAGSGDEPDARLTLRAWLGDLFCTGQAVDWRRLHPQPGRCVPLPAYPWQRQRCWIEPAGRARGGSASERPEIGPSARWGLAGAPIATPAGIIHHRLAVGTHQQPFLADHTVGGRLVVPGMFQLACVLATAAERWPDRGHELSGIELIKPLILDAGVAVDLHLLLEPAGAGSDHRFQIATRAPEGSWRTHARGQLRGLDHAPPSGTSDTSSCEAGRPLDPEALYAGLAGRGIVWGPRWRRLSGGRVADGALRAQLAPDPAGQGWLAPAHPALLDNLFGASLLLLDAAPAEAGARVPFTIEALRCWGSGTGGAAHGAVRRRSGGLEASSQQAMDISLWSDDGALRVEVEGLVTRAAAPEQALDSRTATPADRLYRLAWRRHEQPREGERPAGTWIVVARPDSALGAALQTRLAPSILVQPEALAPLLAEGRPWAGIVCLWEEDEEQASVPARARGLVDQALTTLRALKGTSALRQWWVTQAAIAVEDGDPVRPALAALWGLGRTLPHERADQRLTMVDLSTDAAAADDLARELCIDDDETQVAWRAGTRHRARLARCAAVSPPEAPTPIDAARAGTVLITGGLGALGGRVARHLAARGVSNLLLVGRHGAETPGAAELLEELQALGARVTVAAVDIADRAALAEVLTAVSSDAPLRGVVHAAGVLDDGLVAQMSLDRFERVLEPKVDGGWNLHELTASLELSFFVSFSSVVGLVGAPGQGNYAAANAFLDALVTHRRRMGLPAHSLAWGPWAEAGMAAALGAVHRARLARHGLAPLAPPSALASMDLALAQTQPVLAVMQLDVARVDRPVGAATAAVWRELLGTESSSPAARPPDDGADTTGARRWRSDEVRALVRDEVARLLALEPSAVSLNQPLQELGLDSLVAVDLRRALGDRFKVTAPSTLAFDHPTVDALSAWLLARLPQAPAPAEPAARPAPAVQAPASPGDQPVAIVGMACRFPGDVNDPESFWRLLRDGVDAISDMPRDRWDAEALYSPDPDAPGTIATRSGGFLRDIDRFDAGFFGIAPREAKKMDPQQRLLLETAWEALERSGIRPEQLAGTDTAVYVGLMYQEYGALAAERGALDGYVSTGSAASVASGRLSYVLGLKGPCMTVDTACSSSLVALHLACRALRDGEATAALAGGVSLMLTPAPFIEFSRLRGLAPDGRCKSFSERADGVAWAEGCGMLLLKRLADAERDGDPVLAVIRGSAVNHDGRSNGLTAPNGPSQESVVRAALSHAGVIPSQVGYVECHGTGTKLGDPIEVQALGAALAGAARAVPATIGTVKANIGHTQAAAGVAGVIKVALAFEHQQIPASLHADPPSPHIAWSDLPLRVARTSVPWPRNGERRIAGVSSFGLSGTNAHVVLEEPPVPAPRASDGSGRCELVVLSARSEAALAQVAERLGAHLDARPDLPLSDVALTLAVGRSALEERLALAVRSTAELRAALAIAARGEVPPGAARARRTALVAPVAFLLPGAGAAAAGDGGALSRQWPAFREAFDRARSARVALQAGLVALWRSWGIEPAVVATDDPSQIAAGLIPLPEGVRVETADGLAQRAPGAYVEMGPRSWLDRLSPAPAAAMIPALADDGSADAGLQALGALWSRGYDLRWQAVCAPDARRVVLPTYPWQRQSYWLDARWAAPSRLLLPETITPRDGAEPVARLSPLRDRLRGLVAEALGVPADQSIPDDAGFFDLGMDSLMAVKLRDAVQALLGRELPIGIVIENPTVAALAEHLARMAPVEQVQAPVRHQEPLASSHPRDRLNDLRARRQRHRGVES